MSQNECEHIRPDGARCQAPLQTGRSFCFFHDPEQQENRAAARRNGGFMRDRPSEPESNSNSMAALNLALVEVNKVDDIIPILVDTINLFRRGKITRAEAHAIISACGVMVRVFREKRQAEREARQAAEAVKAAEREIPGFNSQSRFSGTDENSPPFQRREEVGQDQFHAAAGTRAAQQSAPTEEPIVIDASKPWDLSQFGGKKPRISCVVPIFTSMRTGKIIDVNEPNPLDPPEHMLRDEFRRKPASPNRTAEPASSQAAPPEHTLREEFPRSTVPGTKNIPCFVPRRERNASDHSEGLREGVRNQESSAVGAACVSPARKGWVGGKEEEPHRSAAGPRTPPFLR